MSGPDCVPASARCWGREGRTLSRLASGLQDGGFLAEAPEGIFSWATSRAPHLARGALPVPAEHIALVPACEHSTAQVRGAVGVRETQASAADTRPEAVDGGESVWDAVSVVWEGVLSKNRIPAPPLAGPSL